MVRVQTIREAHRSQPFRPFVLRMADGRAIRVDHPEFMFVSRDGRTVVFETPAGRVEFLDSLLMTGRTIPE